MRPTQRAPITDAEREAMRQRRREGASLDEIAVEFSCARMTTRKICANVVERTYERGIGISQEKIDQIIAFRKEGRSQPDIARLVGVSLQSVTKYTPPDLKICRPRGEQKKSKPARWTFKPPVEKVIQIRWDKEETKSLCDMLDANMSIRDIAIKLKRSYVSVKDKVGRLSKTKVVKPKQEPEIELEEVPKFFPAKCLRCLRIFDSYDPRKNRICARCKSNEGWW